MKAIVLSCGPSLIKYFDGIDFSPRTNQLEVLPRKSESLEIRKVKEENCFAINNSILIAKTRLTNVIHTYMDEIRENMHSDFYSLDLRKEIDVLRKYRPLFTLEALLYWMQEKTAISEIDLYGCDLRGEYDYKNNYCGKNRWEEEARRMFIASCKVSFSINLFQ